jgi:hypothetical protein
MEGRLGYPTLTSRCRAAPSSRLGGSGAAHRGSTARLPLALRGLQSRCVRLHGLSVGIFETAFAAEASITETERCGM